MAIFSHYGTGQRVGFVLVGLGFALCFIGSIAPYWMTAKTSIKGILDDIDIGDVTLFEVNVGVWYYCANYLTDTKCYSLYDTSDYKGHEDEDRFAWIQVVRCCVFFNVLLSLVAGLVACCRCMCCSGGRTICHGFLSFFAGVFGVIGFVVFMNNTKSLLNVPIIDTEYDWAAWMFTLGSVLLVIASFVLCCALPRDATYGLVVAQPGPGISVNVNNTNTNTNVGQYNAGGPIRSYEPLPHHVSMPPPTQPQPPPQPLLPYGFQPTGNNPPAYNYNQPGPDGYYNQPGVAPPAEHTDPK